MPLVGIVTFPGPPCCWSCRSGGAHFVTRGALGLHESDRHVGDISILSPFVTPPPPSSF